MHFSETFGARLQNKKGEKLQTTISAKKSSIQKIILHYAAAAAKIFKMIDLFCRK